MTELNESPAPSSPGRRRTAARLAAVQALYQIDLTDATARGVVSEFKRHRLDGKGEDEIFGKADQALFTELVDGITTRIADLDAQIVTALTTDWTIDRLEIILRAILRAGTYELMVSLDVPARVAISEYMEIAHSFYAGKEPGLVNGVLDRLAKTLRASSLPEETGGRRGAGPR